MTNPITPKRETKLITNHNLYRQILIHLDEFQQVLDKAYGLNAGTVGQLKYDQANPIAKAYNTNDGFAIMQGLNFAETNELKEFLRVWILDVARRTNILVGDGTTTAMLLAIGLCKNIMSAKLSRNTFGIKKELKQELKELEKYTINLIKKVTNKKVDKEILYNYALLATRDEAIAKDIADLVNKLPVGAKPTIGFDNNGLQTTTKYECYQNSFLLPSTIGSHDFFPITKYELEIENAYIVATLQAIVSNKETRQSSTALLMPLIDIAIRNNENPKIRNFMIIAPDLDDDAIRFCYFFDKYIEQAMIRDGITKKGTFTLTPLKVGKSGEHANHDYNVSIYEDFEALMGTHAFNNHKNETIAKLTFDDIGFAKTVIIRLDKTIFIDPKSNKKLIKQQIARAQSLLEDTDSIVSDKMLKDFVDKRTRLLLFSSYVTVGASTHGDMANKFKLIEDGIYGACNIKEHGFVAGANIMLVHAFRDFYQEKGDDIDNFQTFDNMTLPMLLLGENSGYLNIVEEILDGKFTGYTQTINLKTNEVAEPNTIIDSSQMLIEVVRSAFSMASSLVDMDQFSYVDDINNPMYEEVEVIELDEEEDEPRKVKMIDFIMITVLSVGLIAIQPVLFGCLVIAGLIWFTITQFGD